MSRIACMSKPEQQSCLCHLNIHFFILISWFCLCARAVQISFKMCKNLLPSVTMLCICVCVCISMRQNRRAVCMLWEIRSVLRCTADWRLWAYELRGLDIDSIMLVLGTYCSECLWITPQFPPNGRQSASATLCGPLYYRSRLLRPIHPTLPLFTLPAAYQRETKWLPHDWLSQN